MHFMNKGVVARTQVDKWLGKARVRACVYNDGNSAAGVLRMINALVARLFMETDILRDAR